MNGSVANAEPHSYGSVIQRRDAQSMHHSDSCAGIALSRVTRHHVWQTA